MPRKLEPDRNQLSYHDSSERDPTPGPVASAATVTPGPGPARPGPGQTPWGGFPQADCANDLSARGTAAGSGLSDSESAPGLGLRAAAADVTVRGGPRLRLTEPGKDGSESDSDQACRDRHKD